MMMAMTREVFWTNESVLALAAGRDPVQTITERARQVVYEALEGGWQGPPYDPFELASLLRIQTVPRDEVHDARLIVRGGRSLIEFNPSCPRGRVRFTIAHELAHSFFPDYATRPRFRSKTEEAASDEWQLELLCNLAAAELLMPIGSFRDLEHEPLRIERLMELRKRFDVSAEALLLRTVHLRKEPAAVVALAPYRRGRAAFRVDYSVGTQRWSPKIARGTHIPSTSVVAECTAVGFTAKRTERWPRVGELRVEAVGIPPYPGTALPRVLALLLPDYNVGEGEQHRLVEVYGDATEPRGTGLKLIVHMVNDQTPNWGGVFARALRARLPEAQELFRNWAISESRLRLGEIHFGALSDDLNIATIVAQKGYGESRTPRIRYAALQRGLENVAEFAKQSEASVHMPRIGTGQAGGDWRIIREMIDQTLVSEGIDVNVYIPPGTELGDADSGQLTLSYGSRD